MRKIALGRMVAGLAWPARQEAQKAAGVYAKMQAAFTPSVAVTGPAAGGKP